MKEYFYNDGLQNNGPFKPEELKNKNITRETLVWCEGMDDWQKAGEIEELKFLFAAIPPPLKKSTPPPLNVPAENKQPPAQKVKKAKSKTTKNILIILIVIFIIAVAGFFLMHYLNSNINIITPDKVAEKFLNHISKKEFADAKKLATPESAASIDMLESFGKMGGEQATKESKIEGLKCKEDQDIATCDYYENGEAKKLDLVKKDDKWLVVMKKESPDQYTAEQDSITAAEKAKKEADSLAEVEKERQSSASTQNTSVSSLIGTYSYTNTWTNAGGFPSFIAFSINIFIKNNSLFATYKAEGHMTGIDYNCSVKISGNAITLYLLSYGDYCSPCNAKIGDKIISFIQLSNGNLKNISGGDIWKKEL